MQVRLQMMCKPLIFPRIVFAPRLTKKARAPVKMVSELAASPAVVAD
jgi:hypothetical protein